MSEDFMKKWEPIRNSDIPPIEPGTRKTLPAREVFENDRKRLKEITSQLSYSRIGRNNV